MSYQGQTWVDEVALPQLQNGGELLVMLRVANHAGNGPKKMSGCYASAKALAQECLMGRSTVLKHLRNLAARGLLVPGDPALVDHLPADRRPPVYDLGGAHVAACAGGHADIAECQTVTGARSEHPQKKPSSAGARSEHPTPDTGSTGVQIELQRVFKSSTKSSKELKESSLCAAGPSDAPDPGLVGGASDEERESAPAAEDQPVQAAFQVLTAYEEVIGGPALNGTRVQLLADAADLLAARPLWWVIDRARELPQFGKSLARHAEMSLVPFTEKTPQPAAPSGPPMCARHPAFKDGDCSPCRKEERARREKSEPGPVDGAGLLARLRAAQPVA